jgi:flagellar basal-body rod modification protein FlgD
MATSIVNHSMAAVQALAGASANPMAATSSSSSARADATSSSSSTTSSSATISANDFLTLLVTEMKNQDPTSDTDPNEYINQLVNVNSLEQLISINQTLTTDLGSSTASSASSGSSAQAVSAASGVSGSTSSSTPAASSNSGTGVVGAISAAAAQLAPGNLGIPAANPAAQRVAQSLSGQ